MKPIFPTSPKVSIGIPLYKSARFLDIIISNIEAMPKGDIEILISDRHCCDDAIDILQERFAKDSRIRFFKSYDEIDWVGNINFLLQQATGDYWMFLPHDDTFPTGSLDKLISALVNNPGAILAYGLIKAIDLYGNALPEKENLNPHPTHSKDSWTLNLALEMFWMGHFNGAFKGLIRRKVLVERNLFIRKTADNIMPERCWLFGLCLLGSFVFVPEALYIKRFYDESTHGRWNVHGRHYISATYVMISYLWDFVKPLHVRLYGVWDLWLNARRYARWQDSQKELIPRPRYHAYPDPIVFIAKKIFPDTWPAHFRFKKRRNKAKAIRRLKLPTF